MGLQQRLPQIAPARDPRGDVVDREIGDFEVFGDLIPSRGAAISCAFMA
jgi:hypothetical protein